jgi:membrane protease YdiL (CAAX protease family)
MKLVWQLGAVAVVAFAGGQVLGAVEGAWPARCATGVATAVLAVLVYGWVVRRTEHRPSLEVSRQGAAGGLVRGMLIGAVAFGLVIANIACLGYYHVHGRGSVTGAVGLFGFMAAAAATEELMFRGVLLRIIEGRFGTWTALVAVSAVFGAQHLTNADATVWGAVAIAIEGGGMLGAAYIATRKLWVPIGLHFAWNFAESGVFSTEASGNGASKGLLDSTTSSGHALVTGGAFGPEGSLYSVVFCSLVTLGFLLLARRRGHILPPRRRVAAAVPAAATVAR